MKNEQLEVAIRQSKKEYYKKYRQENKETIKRINERYWRNKAIKIMQQIKQEQSEGITAS